MNKSISKSMILKAIDTESLAYGQFLTAKYGAYHPTYTEDSSCSVCAVGAILRIAGLPSELINKKAGRYVDDVCYLEQGDITFELKRGNYLGALSMYFESFDDEAYSMGEVSHAVRIELKKFVLKHFPDKLILKKWY